MPSVTTNWFEIERRNIMFKSTTTMPDGSSLGYDGDPNFVINGNTDGETLLYNSPIATMYTQDNGDIWYKKQLQNTWVKIGGSSGGDCDCYTIIEKTVASGSEEIFFTLDLNTIKSFEWTTELSNTDRYYTSKVMAVYSESVLDSNEFGILGYYFDMNISVYKDGTNCIFKIINNETFDLNCKIKYYN